MNTQNSKFSELTDESSEREFWESHDSSGRIGWSKARQVSLPKLKPSTDSISIRLPESLREHLKKAV